MWEDTVTTEGQTCSYGLRGRTSETFDAEMNGGNPDDQSTKLYHEKTQTQLLIMRPTTCGTASHFRVFQTSADGLTTTSVLYEETVTALTATT